MTMRSWSALLTLILLASTVQAANESALREVAVAAPVQANGNLPQEQRKVFIVQLHSPSAAELHAKTVAKSAVRPQRNKLDKNSAAVQSHTAKIALEQESVLAKAGDNVTALASYRYGLNGFSASMTQAQAEKLEALPEVARVWEDEVRPLATNQSASFLGLFDADVGLRGAQGLSGEGIVIGVIDSGFVPGHPSLLDTREASRPRACQGSWAETSLLGRWLCTRYRRQDDVVLFEAPQNWNGICQTGEQFTEDDCNNKVIGARWFADGARNTGPIDDGEIFSARDVDGHGTHTATTAAGNRAKASIYGTSIGEIEGIAPKARIAVYKACWLRPGESRASCNTSDLAAAIDAAVADGVDLINYSVGSSDREISAADDLALLSATKAGVLTVVAAGNEGPGFDSIGSPAGGPWVITAAASSRAGDFSVEAAEITAPASIAGRIAMKEANFTPALADNGPVEGRLVLVDDADSSGVIDGPGTESDACQALVNSGEVSGNIALIQRGGCNFDTKVRNVASAGASAALVYNIAGDPIVMSGTAATDDVPALMIGQADGNLILAELDAGNDVTVLLEKGLLLTQSDTANVMATFSGRGPGPVPDILKPDVSAPGVNILAGFSAAAINAMSGEDFAYLSGTSMATPHVTGVAALLMEAHPDWSPAAIKSALMTTARRDLTVPDRPDNGIAFDYGSGHIVANDALDPGLVYDVSNDEYNAFACGIGAASITQTQCDALAAAGHDFAASSLNQPAIALSGLIGSRTVSRTLHNPGPDTLSFTASVEAPDGVSVSVNPSSITVPAGGSVSFDVTLQFISGQLDLWRFGSLTWTGTDHEIYSSLAVRPASIAAAGEITAVGGSGSFNLPVQFGYSGAYQATVHGLSLPRIINGFVDNDPTKTFTVRNGAGVTQHIISVPPEQLYLRFALFDALTDGNDDLDMYIYFSTDQQNWTKIGQSGEPTSQERFDQLFPAAGFYAVLIHGFETDQVAGGPGANYQLLGWSFGTNDDRGNMTASGPALVMAGATENIAVNWSNLNANTIYFGGISHNTPQGFAGITLITIGN